LRPRTRSAQAIGQPSSNSRKMRRRWRRSESAPLNAGAGCY
jgi:hypothetical protein